jgi:type IV pilus assembly protein PilB
MVEIEEEKQTDKQEQKTAFLSEAGLSVIKKLVKPPKEINNEVASLVPREVAKKHQFLFFDKKGNKIKVAMVNPQDMNALNIVRFAADKENLDAEIYEVSQDVFAEMMEFYTMPVEMVKEAVDSFKSEALFEESQTEKEAGEKKISKAEILKDAPVAKLVEVIVSHAIEGRASDIHIEPEDKDYRVRYRVDGVLHISLILPKEVGLVVISRIKIMANLKIDERRKPQDGRFNLKINRTDAEKKNKKTEKIKDVDFRVSTLPVLLGEKLVMRILEKDETLVNMNSLGLWGSSRESLLLAIQETYGMVLITGPTGSGKSTTLYFALKILNQEEKNIITLEDPIEYNIEGINQSQVNPEIGYTFANGLRTILRQDPNIIMLGEIRDSETAALSVHAALTGHLVLSTLHTNTAIGAVPRLIDMGVEPFLLASSLRMVIAQRLVRKICENCREEIQISESIKNRVAEEIKNISPEELKKYEIDLNAGLHFFKGKGCKKCGNLGLKGRVAVYEVVPISEAMKEIIIEKKGNDSLLTQERDKEKIVTMKQDGLLKLLKGITTIEEVERVTEGSIGLLIDEE